MPERLWWHLSESRTGVQARFAEGSARLDSITIQILIHNPKEQSLRLWDPSISLFLMLANPLVAQRPEPESKMAQCTTQEDGSFFGLMLSRAMGMKKQVFRWYSHGIHSKRANNHQARHQNQKGRPLPCKKGRENHIFPSALPSKHLWMRAPNVHQV